MGRCGEGSVVSRGPGRWLRGQFRRLGWMAMNGLIVVALSFLVVACNIKVRVGNQPDTTALEKTLRIGESTRADVVAALGEPFGKGRAMLATDDKPRTMWSYYYEEGDLNDDRRIFLFVYFIQDRYDGYMWFSSLPK